MSQLEKDGREERVHVGAFVDREQRDQIFELAEQRDRSVSSILRRALAAELERERHGDKAAQTSADRGGPET